MRLGCRRENEEPSLAVLIGCQLDLDLGGVIQDGPVEAQLRRSDIFIATGIKHNASSVGGHSSELQVVLTHSNPEQNLMRWSAVNSALRERIVGTKKKWRNILRKAVTHQGAHACLSRAWRETQGRRYDALNAYSGQALRRARYLLGTRPSVFAV